MIKSTVQGAGKKSEAFESIEENDLALVGGGCGVRDVVQGVSQWVDNANQWFARASTAIGGTINQIVNDPASVADGLRRTFPALWP